MSKKKKKAKLENVSGSLMLWTVVLKKPKMSLPRSFLSFFFFSQPYFYFLIRFMWNLPKFKKNEEISVFSYVKHLTVTCFFFVCERVL